MSGVNIPVPDFDRDLDDKKAREAFVKNVSSRFICVRDDAELEAEERKEREKLYEERFRKWCPIEKFKDVEFSEIGELKDVVFGRKAEKATKSLFENFINDVASGKPRMLWLCGKPGTGKTTISLAVMRELCRRGKTCAYYKSHKMMQEIKESEKFSSKETPSGIISDVCLDDFRIVDEIGRYPNTEWESFRMFEICNDLYEQRKSAAFITNMTSREFADFIGSAATDRFRGIGLVLEFRGESFRGMSNELYA